MDKRDIYEHLAKIYLDSSPANEKKSKSKSAHKKRYFYAVPIAAAASILLAVFASRVTPGPLNAGFPGMQLSVLVSHEPIKINFNLDSAKKQVFDFDLKRINLSGYKALSFSLKNSNYSDVVSFRIEIANAYQERAELYVTNSGNKWQEYSVDLADFTGITDWSEVTALSFIIEEWNTRENRGILLIDNVRFLK